MKLKLENQDGITILSISEGIDSQQVAVLKAGLNKIFQTGKKYILLDLTPLDAPPNAETQGELAAIPAWAHTCEAQVLIASKVAGLGETASRQEAIQKLSSPLYRLLAHENQLRERLRKLREKKAQMESELANVAGGRAEVLKIKRANSDLKKQVFELESQVRKQLKSRGGDRDPAQVDVIATKMAALQKTLVAVLEQEGMLPVT